MEIDHDKKHKFGLVGKNISYSFSKTYFAQKFEKLGLENYSYENFDLPKIDLLPSLIHESDTLKGLNVTIPYKEEVMPLLDAIDDEAEAIGAVNTIKITKNKKLIGYNTDVFGFKTSIQPLLKSEHTKAIILGTGGASKAVSFALQKLGIQTLFVSRNPSKPREISYTDLTKNIVLAHPIIINCTPLGTYPNIEACPQIPYEYLTEKHVLYDLIYNPSQSLFLKKGLEMKATTANGLKMLELQAEKSWEIWNS